MGCVPYAGAMDLDLSAAADVVAPLLLGAIIRHGAVAVRLTEVEAYLGVDDPASHAWRGPTPRTRVMFGPPGRLYVYLSYGIHHCVNVVCSPDGTASAVLLRSGEVIAGHDEVRRRRGAVPPRRWASGPGNLGSALGAGLDDSGEVLSRVVAHAVPGSDDGDHGAWSLKPAGTPSPVEVGPRIGITRNGEAPLRFWIPGEPTVSATRRRKNPR